MEKSTKISALMEPENEKKVKSRKGVAAKPKKAKRKVTRARASKETKSKGAKKEIQKQAETVQPQAIQPEPTIEAKVEKIEKTPYDERPWLKNYSAGTPHTIEIPNIPLHAIFEASAKKYPNNPAIIFQGRTIFYRDLLEMVNRFAAALAKLGIKKGDRVALYMPNSTQYMIAYYGALRAGAAVVQVNPMYTADELEAQMNDSGAETIVTITKFYPNVNKARSKTKLKNVIVTNIKDYFPTFTKLLFTLVMEKKDGHRVEIREPGVYGFTDLIANNPPQPPKIDFNPEEDIALFQYTGGTTGIPKGAMLTHKNLVANAYQCMSWFPDAKLGKEICMSVLPFFHVFGMTVGMNLPILLGAAIITMPRPDIDETLKLIQKYRVTFFPGVPTLYVGVVNNPNTPKYDISSIKSCISGAAALPVEILKQFEKITGSKLIEGYGLTEASPVTHANPLFGKRKEGSIGLPFPNTDVRIVDIDTGVKILGVGEAGEMIIRGPQVMKGYWNKPDETKDTLRNGWLYTGDIAKMDEEGYFYIVDRKKDMVNVSGFNVYPRDVEEVLYKHPKVKEAAVVGVPNSYQGESVKAYVVLKEGQTATEEEIRSFCKEHLANYKVPKFVEFKKELPKTMVGKVLRRELKEAEEKKMKGAETK